MSTIYIVTGINNGLGRAFAELILESEDSLLSISRKLNTNFVELLIKGKFYHIEQDFGQEINLDQTPAIEILNNYKRIVFINNAADIHPIRKFEDISELELERSITINIVSPLRLINFLIKNFKNSKIDFVNITSGASNKQIANWSLYSSSKAYLYRFFEILKEENKRNTDLSFSSIDPGMLDTNMQNVIRTSDFPDHSVFMEAKHKGKLLEPRDAALKILNSILK